VNRGDAVLTERRHDTGVGALDVADCDVVDHLCSPVTREKPALILAAEH
jgi:hypothetical protein